MLTVLKFKADWCGPCKAMNPIMEKLKEEYPTVIFQDVDIDDNPQLRHEYGVRTIPTFVAVMEKKEVGRRASSGTLSDMREFINEHRGV